MSATAAQGGDSSKNDEPPKPMDTAEAKKVLAESMEKTYGKEITLNDMSRPHRPRPPDLDLSAVNDASFQFQPNHSSTPNNSGLADSFQFQPNLNSTPNNSGLADSFDFGRPGRRLYMSQDQGRTFSADPNATFNVSNPNATFNVSNPMSPNQFNTLPFANPNGTFNAASPNCPYNYTTQGVITQDTSSILGERYAGQNGSWWNRDASAPSPIPRVDTPRTAAMRVFKEEWSRGDLERGQQQEQELEQQRQQQIWQEQEQERLAQELRQKQQKTLQVIQKMQMGYVRELQNRNPRMQEARDAMLRAEQDELSESKIDRAKDKHYMTVVAEICNDMAKKFVADMTTDLPPITENQTKNTMKDALPDDRILDVMKAAVPDMIKRQLREKVFNAVDNMINVYLGERTIPELFPFMACNSMGCSKPCKCPRNKGPNGLPVESNLEASNEVAPACPNPNNGNNSRGSCGAPPPAAGACPRHPQNMDDPCSDCSEVNDMVSQVIEKTMAKSRIKDSLNASIRSPQSNNGQSCARNSGARTPPVCPYSPAARNNASRNAGGSCQNPNASRNAGACQNPNVSRNAGACQNPNVSRNAGACQNPNVSRNGNATFNASRNGNATCNASRNGNATLNASRNGNTTFNASVGGRDSIIQQQPPGGPGSPGPVGAFNGRRGLYYIIPKDGAEGNVSFDDNPPPPCQRRGRNDSASSGNSSFGGGGGGGACNLSRRQTPNGSRRVSNGPCQNSNVSAGGGRRPCPFARQPQLGNISSNGSPGPNYPDVSQGGGVYLGNISGGRGQQQVFNRGGNACAARPRTPCNNNNNSNQRSRPCSQPPRQHPQAVPFGGFSETAEDYPSYLQDSQDSSFHSSQIDSSNGQDYLGITEQEDEQYNHPTPISDEDCYDLNGPNSSIDRSRYNPPPEDIINPYINYTQNSSLNSSHGSGPYQYGPPNTPYNPNRHPPTVTDLHSMDARHPGYYRNNGPISPSPLQGQGYRVPVTSTPCGSNQSNSDQYNTDVSDLFNGRT